MLSNLLWINHVLIKIKLSNRLIVNCNEKQNPHEWGISKSKINFDVAYFM